MTKAQIHTVYSPYRIQQLAVQAAIDSGDFDKASEIAMMNPIAFARKPREPAQTGTIRNNSENSDFAYRIGKRISQIIRRLSK